MPQLDKVSFLSQFFWLTFFYFVIYFYLVKHFLPSISRIRKVRSSLMVSSEQNAQGSKPQAEKAQEIISEATTCVSDSFSTAVSEISKAVKDSKTNHPSILPLKTKAQDFLFGITAKKLIKAQVSTYLSARSLAVNGKKADAEILNFLYKKASK